MLISDQLIRRLPGIYGPSRRLIGRVARLDSNELMAFQQKSLSRVLRWARDLPAAYPAVKAVDRLPLLTKDQLRRNGDAYLRNNRLPVSGKKTSGTTGVALNLRRSLPSLIFEQAMIDWVVEQASHDYRNERVVVLRGDDVKPLDDTSPPFWKRSNAHTLVLSSNHLTPANLRLYLSAIRDFRPDILYAYPSMADRLAELVASADEQLHFPLVLCSSEALPTLVRGRIAEVFRAHVVDYYGQGERVAFAYSVEPGSYKFHPAYGYVELLPTDQQASREIVGTSFHNSAQIFLRYRTGDFIELADTGSVKDIANGFAGFCGIAGRTEEFLRGPAGEVLIGLNHIPKGLEQYGRMQVIQDTVDRVEILIQSSVAGSSAARSHILQRCRLKIPSSINVEVKFVDELVRTKAGKVPFLIRRI